MTNVPRWMRWPHAIAASVGQRADVGCQFASNDMGNTGVGTICHPNCGGMIHFELGAIWTGICQGYDAYDPEGNRDGIYRFCGGRLQHFADAHVFERLTERQLR